MDTNSIEKLLRSKGISITPEEGSLLQAQWEAIQELKGDFDDIAIVGQDIAVTHVLGRG